MNVIEPVPDWSSLWRLYASAETLLKMGAWECDLATERLTWTPGVYELFDLPRGLRVERSRVVDLYEESSRAGMETLRAAALRSGAGFSLDARIVTTTGERRWMRLTADIEVSGGKAIRLFGTKQDITRQRCEWDRLRLRAERDSLTALANRDTFEHRLRAALADDRSLAALILVDVDHFKTINDGLGHAAGDAVLCEMARRLSRLFADALTVARIGGDEFAVLVRAPAERQDLATLGARAVQRLKRSVLWNGQPIPVSASVGVAPVASGRRLTRDDLFAEADAALYAAKAAGRAACRFAARDGSLEMSLRSA